MRTALTILPLALFVAACGGGTDDSAPGGVTRDQARQLDEAAAATDVNAAVVQPDPDDQENAQ